MSEMVNAKVRIKYSFIKIHTGSDLSRRRLPLMHAESANPGPVVWLTACAHGDEVGGIAVIQEVFKKLKVSLLNGSIYAFPLMNPTGFENSSRQIVMSQEDLNRSFPGNISGSLAERIANIIFNRIIETGPAVVLDLHNDWSKSIPYTVIDPNPGPGYREVHDRTKKFAAMTGFVNVLEPKESETEKSLSFSLLKKGVPSIVLELGESYVVNEKNIAYGVSSIFNVLAELGMVARPIEPFRYPMPYPVMGKLLETLVSQHDCIVLGHTDYSVAFPGASVMVFGEV